MLLLRDDQFAARYQRGDDVRCCIRQSCGYHLGMRAGAMILLAAVLSLGAACGDDDPIVQAPVTTLVETPIVIQTPTVAPTLPAPTVSGSAPAILGAPSPEAAARRLYGYWLAEDPLGARAVASQEAIDQLFNSPPSEIEFTGCEPDAVTFVCFFYYEGGGLNIIVEPAAPNGYAATRAFFIAD